MFNKYEPIFNQKSDSSINLFIGNKKFVKENSILVYEFVEILQIIYDKKMIYLDHVY